jgi:hypothetical protein
MSELSGGLTTRWRRPGMRRDLHVVELFCYLGKQELEKSQAPQLKAVGRHNNRNT